MAVDRKAADAAITAMMVRQGFKRRKYGLFTRPQCDDVLAWVGMNKASGPGWFTMNMIVGLRFAKVQALVSELRGSTDDGLTLPTVAGNVGYVAGRAHGLFVEFSSDADIEPGVKQLEAALVRDAYPFFSDNCSLPALKNVLTRGTFVHLNVEHHLPVVLLMLGQGEEALEYVRVQLEEREGRVDPEAERYRSFAAALVERVSGAK